MRSRWVEVQPGIWVPASRTVLIEKDVQDDQQVVVTVGVEVGEMVLYRDRVFSTREFNSPKHAATMAVNKLLAALEDA